MNNLSDQQLLREYGERRSEAAFSELVRRHIDLVHTAAFRMTGERHFAKDIAQGVFVILAQEAGQLMSHPVLAGWLHTTARNLAAKHIRATVRRQVREQEAASMNELLNNDSEATWCQIAPHLDAALGELNEEDRDAVLLRYFENKTGAEIAATLGISSDAAHKRVSRAVERMHEFLTKRGITLGASGLVILISANAVKAAPVGLASAISAAALSGGVAMQSAVLSTAKTFTLTTLQKISITAMIVIGAAGIFWLSAGRSHQVRNSNIVNAPAPVEAPSNHAGVMPESAKDDTSDTDPIQLLRTVMRARERIRSGAIDFQYSLERFNHGKKETNQLAFETLFDGRKLRFESFGTEYAYTFDEDAAKQESIQKRADGLSRPDAAKAGLLEEFSSHHTLVQDGNALYDCWQAGNQGPRTDIYEASRDLGAYLFDPRCVGLTTFLTHDGSVSGYLSAKNAELVGVEDIDGVQAFHIRVPIPGDNSLDYWVDKARPDRLIQQTYGLDIVKSKYDEVIVNDPIPTQVDTMSFRNGILQSTSRLVRTKAAYNTEVDAAMFTLAGMNMPVGTWVCDNRLHRSIGYWDGAGLTPNLPSTNATNVAASPKLNEQLALLDAYPTSDEALDSAVWIILNTPDGPAVDKAAEVILQDHTKNTNLIPFCLGLERLRPRCATNVLAAVLQDNPELETRGNACFALATIMKSQAKYGSNLVAKAQAEKLYERVINEFRSAKLRGYSLADLAKPELYELQKLSIGQPAPDTKGVDMDGNTLKLSDYRGKVTVVVFWSGQFIEAAEFRRLKEDMAGKPFALLGVNSDNEYSRDQASVDKVNWPSFRDGRDGPISKLWNSRCWPDIWVLDQRGTIRYRELRGSNLKDAVNHLLAE